MDINSKSKLKETHIEISDLIDEAVANATVRREQALSELSGEQAENITGGLWINIRVLGYFIATR